MPLDANRSLIIFGNEMTDSMHLKLPEAEIRVQTSQVRLCDILSFPQRIYPW